MNLFFWSDEVETNIKLLNLLASKINKNLLWKEVERLHKYMDSVCMQYGL